MSKKLNTIAGLLAFISASLSAMLLVRNRAPRGFMLWFPKLLAGALTPVTALTGAVSALLGLLLGAPLTALLGGFSAVLSTLYVRQVTEPHDGFDRAFGPGWRRKIGPEQSARMLPRRWNGWLPEHGAVPQVDRDIAFWTLPGSGRKLLCDLWQPPAGVRPSGLAFIYFHGSAWTMLDKDVGTRPFFRHLVRQGHLVMDVAYRLSPETAIPGMVGDVKRAIAWMKCNAARYGASPDKIVIGGGSAGGHLSMLAAYAPKHPDLTPVDVRGEDLSVRAVISEYGPTDLTACYYQTNQDKTTRGKAARPAKENPGMDRMMRRLMGDRYEQLGFKKSMAAGSFLNLIGGHPDEMLEKYALLSPVTHVCADCPPTLLIQGEDDLIAPVGAARTLAQKLQAAGVPVVNVVFPQTDHGFDLMLPAFSPTAQSALYDVERFLALMAC